jgi:hypothetical protein
MGVIAALLAAATLLAAVYAHAHGSARGRSYRPL